MVEGEDCKFTGREAENGQTTKQLRSRIGGLNPQAGSRVTPVMSGHPTGNDTIQRLVVSSNTAGNTGEIVARRGPQNSNMISFCGERERATIHSKGRDLLPVCHRNITFWGKS